MYTRVLPLPWPGHAGDVGTVSQPGCPEINPGNGRFPGEILSSTPQAAGSLLWGASRELLSAVGRALPVHREAMFICWAGWAASGGWRWGCAVGSATVWWAGPGAWPHHSYCRVQLVGDALRALCRVGRSVWQGASPGWPPPPPMRFSVPVWPGDRPDGCEAGT